MPTICSAIAFFTFCLFPSLVLSTQTQTGGFDDPYIVCTGERAGPPATFGPWPVSYSADQYRDNIDLCSAAYGKREGASGATEPGSSLNLGCQCSTANTRPHCHEDLADPVLWRYRGFSVDPIAAVLNPGQDQPMTFQNYCANIACYCTTVAIELTYFTANMLGAGEFEYAGSGSSVADLLPIGVLPYNDALLNNTIFQAQCAQQEGGGCTTIADCNVHTTVSTNNPSDNASAVNPPPDNDDYDTDPPCVCQAQNSTVQGDLTHFYHYSSCFSLLGRKNKRDGAEDYPCPCNTTYVSHKCCTARDGLVWEAPEAKLGELMLDQEL